MSKTVTWKRLYLRGFGCYADGAELDLVAGLNNIVAPNEHGKSTLVAGLIAVLFGLPNISDPDRFGKAKHRSLTPSAVFEGEVVFSVGDDAYTLKRDFDSDRILLALQTAEGWQEIAGGVHRPGARRANVVYLDALADLIGISSPDLFASTFVVEQPLPEPGQVSSEIQELLSGSGVGANQALDTLEDWLQARTRYTAELGVGRRNKNKDRELELLEQEISGLRQTITDSRQSIDDLHALKEAISLADKSKSELQAVYAQKQALYDAWARWLNLRDGYDRALAEQGKMKQAELNARSVQRQIEETTAAMGNQYPEFQDASSTLSDDLDHLISVGKQVDDLADALKVCAQQSGEQREKIEALESQLSGHMAELVKRPDIVARRDELAAAARELTERQGELERLRLKEGRAQGALSKKGHLSGLADRPLHFYRQLADTTLDTYRTITGEQQALDAAQAELDSGYKVLQEADEQLLDYCRTFHVLSRQLDGQVESAQAALGAAVAQVEEWKAEQREFERQFSDLGDHTDDLIPVLQAKIDLENRRSRLGQTAVGRPVAGIRRPPLWLGLVAAVAALAGPWLALPASVVRSAAGAALVLGLYALLPLITSWRSPLRSELAGLVGELSRVDQALDDLASWPLSELIELHERLTSRQEQIRHLGWKQRLLTPEAEIERLTREESGASDNREQFMLKLQPVLAVFADPQEAYKDWIRLRSRVNGLQTSLEERTSRLYKLEAAAVGSSDPSSLQGWREIASLAAAFASPVGDVEAAAQWLEGLSATEWESWGIELDRYSEAKAELDTCRVQLSAAEETDDQGRDKIQRLQDKIASLRQHIQPFSEDNTTAELRELLARGRKTADNLQLAQGQARALADRHKEYKDRLTVLQSQRDELTVGLSAVLGAADDRPLAAKERLASWRSLEEERQQLSSSLMGLLQGLNVADLDSLSLAALHADNEAHRIWTEWTSLVGSCPGLPSPDRASEIERLNAEFLSLEKDLADLESKRRAVDEESFDLQRRLSALSGRQVINVAAAKDTLRQLELDHDRLRLETEALALAHQELSAASELFSASHRERLMETATEYFSAITGGGHRQVKLDNSFEVTVAEADGQSLRIAQLSQGTKDQLQVALRLAIADLIAGDFVLPVVFDDPFLNFDRHRLAAVKQMLERLSEGRQIIILSHQEQYRNWGLPLSVS